MASDKISAQVEVSTYDGAALKSRESASISLAGESPDCFVEESISIGQDWSVSVSDMPFANQDRAESSDASLPMRKLVATFLYRTGSPKSHLTCSVSVCFKLPPSKGPADRYILLPATVYGNGSRALSRKVPYSPRIPEDLASEGCPLVFNDLFRILPSEGPNPQKESIQILARDTTFPYFAAQGPAPDETFSFELPLTRATDMISVVEHREESGRPSLECRVMTPGVREGHTYFNTSFCRLSEDTGSPIAPGDRLVVEVFYTVRSGKTEPREILADFFKRRSQVSENQSRERRRRHPVCSMSTAFRCVEEKWNRFWDDELQLYPTSERRQDAYYFQAGWCGGMMATLPLLQFGTKTSQERAWANLETFFAQSPIAESGLFLSRCTPAEGFTTEYKFDQRDFAQHFKTLTLVRRQADILYFLQRQLFVAERKQIEFPNSWWDALNSCADAFVRAFEQHGQLGFFLDAYSGKVAIGNSTSGALVPATLVLAHRRSPSKGYLDHAQAVARYLVSQFLDRGFTCGGPGDAMHAPDSESASLLLESLVVLAEETKNYEEWVPAAEAAAHLMSTWVYPYDFPFPEDSSLGRIRAESQGVVFANVQNRHGAPGICTLSGACLLRLFRLTENATYAEMLSEIATSLPQFVSRQDRPISCVVGEKERRDNPPGFINERVNTSYWDPANVGGVKQSSSAWCEAALLLTASVLPSVYVDLETRKTFAFDHVGIRWMDSNTIELANDTKYEATFTVMAETQAMRSSAMEMDLTSALPSFVVHAKSNIVLRWNSLDNPGSVSVV